MTTEELCRDVAFEAWRRDPQVNPHELWATLEAVSAIELRVVVDIRPQPVAWWAWWSLGAHVVGVGSSAGGGSAFTGGGLPSSVVEIVGDPRDPATRLRVADQVAGREVDVVAIGGPVDEADVRSAFQMYAPMVRPGGRVVVAGIANARTPGPGRFWAGLDSSVCTEMVGSTDPDGYGIVEIHGRDTAHHG